MLNCPPFLRRHIVLYDDDVEATCKDFPRLKIKKNKNTVDIYHTYRKSSHIISNI